MIAAEPATDDPELIGMRHFVRLARRGKHRGASGGEKACRRLALALLDNCPGLDGRALDGLERFVRAAVHQPESARELVDGWE